MGMEIKVIFKKHGNAVICMLEGRLALVGQSLKMLCLLSFKSRVQEVETDAFFGNIICTSVSLVRNFK